MPIDELRARCPIRVVLNDGEVELQVLVDSGVAPIFTVLVPRGVERLWSARATPRRGVTREDGAAPGGSPKRSRLLPTPTNVADEVPPPSKVSVLLPVSR